MRKPINRSYTIDEELLDYELELLDRAIVSRRSHLRSVDELDHKDSGPSRLRVCRTNKRKFRDKREAERIRHLITSDHKKRTDGKVSRFSNLKRSYLCGCGYWHHTSQAEYASAV